MQCIGKMPGKRTSSFQRLYLAEIRVGSLPVFVYLTRTNEKVVACATILMKHSRKGWALSKVNHLNLKLLCATPQDTSPVVSCRIPRSFRTAQAVTSCNARFGIDALGERADHVQLIFSKRRVSEVSTVDALELREFMDSSLRVRNTGHDMKTPSPARTVTCTTYSPC